MHERQCQVQPPLHPAGVTTHPAVGRLGQPDALEQLGGALTPNSRRQPLKGGLEHDVLAAGEDRIERRLLERSSDDCSHLSALAGDVIAADGGVPTGGREQRRQHQDGGRLAGTVRAEEAVDLPR